MAKLQVVESRRELISTANEITDEVALTLKNKVEINVAERAKKKKFSLSLRRSNLSIVKKKTLLKDFLEVISH